MTKQNTSEVMLYWTTDLADVSTQSRLATLSIRFVAVTDNNGRSNVRNCSDTTNTAEYDNLQLHCQWNLDPGLTYKAECTYAHQTRYRDVFIVELRDAERMAKMLKRIKRIEQQFPVQPATFSQYVLLVCRGLGIKRYCYTSKPTGWHDEDSHTFRPIAEIQYGIDDCIRKTFPELQPATVAA